MEERSKKRDWRNPRSTQKTQKKKKKSKIELQIKA